MHWNFKNWLLCKCKVSAYSLSFNSEKKANCKHIQGVPKILYRFVTIKCTKILENIFEYIGHK